MSSMLQVQDDNVALAEFKYEFSSVVVLNCLDLKLLHVKIWIRYKTSDPDLKEVFFQLKILYHFSI